MRIGFFTDGFLPQPDGVTTSVFESAKELERRGHEVIIIAPKYPGYVDEGANVIRLTSVRIHKVPDTRISLNLPDKSLRKILSIDFDIVHGHSGGPITFLGWEVARAKKIPFVLTYHTLWNRYTHYFLKGKVVKPKVLEQATKIFGNRVDSLIAPTPRVERELRSYGVKKPIKVIPSGIDTLKFKNAEHGFLREKTGIKKDPILLYVGRLGKEKSVDFIIKSFKYVLQNEPRAQLVIVGDGEERKKLEALAGKIGVAKNTHFIGHVDNDKVHQVYKDADVFVFSSTTETQGLVVLEALSSGVPVVAIDDPAFECIENGVNGYLVNKNMREFALKALSIIKNHESREKLSKAAIASSEKFSVKNTVDSLTGLYFEFLEDYNNESVGRIMKQNENTERLFVANVAFWMTIIISRLFVYFSYQLSDPYPVILLAGQVFYPAALGIIIFLLGLAFTFSRRNVGLLPLLAVGVGLGLVADGAWSVLVHPETVFDYWNPLGFIPILLAGIIPLFFIKPTASDRPKFYISTVEQKHINPDNPKITVVIPAYNEGEFIAPTLKSLINQTYKNFELLVVDNNSSDNTSEVAESYGARVVKETNPGVANARQAGFFASRGEIVASTDADTVVPPDWVEKIVKGYEKNKSLSALGGLNYLYSGAVDARAAGRYLFPWFWRFDKLVSGGWNMAGFNMSVKKEAFIKIGGFNASLKMGEDIDLSEKLRQVGQVHIDSSLIVYSSGRRYKDGLLSGLMAYAPWWISKNILRQDKPFEFQSVRSEKPKNKGFAYLPVVFIVLVLAALFYSANPQLINGIFYSRFL